MCQRLFLVVFCSVFALLALTGEISAKSVFSRLPRAIQEEDSSKTKFCYKSYPCGWTIYTPFSREILDYMPNTCECPNDTKCERADDDISVSAYVHRCRPLSKDSKDLDPSPQVVSP